MKITNQQLALAVARIATLFEKENPRQSDVYNAVAQALCDQPTGSRFRKYAETITQLPALPDDLWAAPLPPIKLATDDLRVAIGELNDGYGASTDLNDWILLRRVQWASSVLARIKEADINREVTQTTLNNGGHTSALWHTPQYVTNDGTTVILDSAEGRAALLGDIGIPEAAPTNGVTA